MRPWLIVLSLCWPVWCGAAVDALHKAIVQERYAEAQAMGVRAVEAAQGDAPAARHRRLIALNDLLDVGIGSRDLTADVYAQWAQHAVDIAAQSNDPTLPSPAKAFAVLAFHARRGDAKQRDAWLDEAVRRAEHDALGAIDASYVYQAQAVIAGDASHFDAAIGALAKAREALKKPADDWQRLRLAVLEVLYGSYGERAGSADALAIAEHGAETIRALSGDASITHAFALTYLGQLRFFRGDYLGAAHDSDAAAHILKSKPEREADLGATLLIRANAQRTLGDYDGAREAYVESIRLARKGPSIVNLSGRINGLGVLEQIQGHDAEAKALFVQALEIVGDKPDDRRAIPLHGNLGQIAMEHDQLDEAQAHFDQGDAIALKVYGERHQSRLDQQHNLAMLALRRGNADDAAKRLEAVTEIQRADYGDDYPPLQVARCHLALALARTGDRAGAWPLALAAERQRVALLRRVLPVLGAAQALAFKRSLRECDGLLLALALDAPEHVAEAWQSIADARGIATHLEAQRLALMRDSVRASAREPLRRWEAATQAYADALLFNAGGDAKALARAQQNLADAEAALGESAREELAPTRADFSLPRSLSTLSDDEAVAAFVQTGAVSLRADAGEIWPKARHYVAFVYEKKSAAMRLVDLGASAARDAEIARWQHALRSPDSADVELRQAGDAVRASLWQPLALVPSSTIAWIPDGAIFRMNPLALPDGEGYFVERGGAVAMLDTERDLDAAASTQAPGSLVLVGAPDFGAVPKHCAAGLAPLSGAAAELRAVRSALPDAAAITLDGGGVRKEALRAALGKADALHVATHLIDVDQTCPSDAMAVRGARVVRDDAPASGTTHQSALALSGANRYFAQHDSSTVLSVPEVLALPLRQLRFVVLAACDSGSGPVEPGEGVFGMRRAFRLAGAKAVVMSLWPVDDAASVPWMSQFYADVANRRSLAQAVAHASRNALQMRRNRNENVHPYYWAAYVVAGARR